MLVVEDHQDMRNMVAMILAEEGHEVVAVADGRSALDEARRGAFQAVVLDLLLPEGPDGVSVARALREVPSTCAAILVAITCSPFSSVIDAAYAAGCDAVIAKPFDVETLLSTLQRPCGRATTGRPSRLVS